MSDPFSTFLAGIVAAETSLTSSGGTSIGTCYAPPLPTAPLTTPCILNRVAKIVPVLDNSPDAALGGISLYAKVNVVLLVSYGDGQSKEHEVYDWIGPLLARLQRDSQFVVSGNGTVKASWVDTENVTWGPLSYHDLDYYALVVPLTGLIYLPAA